MKLNNIKEKLFRMLTEDLDLGYVVDIVKKNLDFKSKMKMIMNIARKSDIATAVASVNINDIVNSSST